MLAATCEWYRERPAFGVYDRRAKMYTTMTYGEVWTRVRQLATGAVSACKFGKIHKQGRAMPWAAFDLTACCKQDGGGKELQRLGTWWGVCGFTSVDWVIADLAVTYCGVVRTPARLLRSSPRLIGRLLHGYRCEA